VFGLSFVDMLTYFAVFVAVHFRNNTMNVWLNFM